MYMMLYTFQQMLLLPIVGYVGTHSLSLGNAYGAYFDRAEAIVFNPASAAMVQRIMASANRYLSTYTSGGIVFPNGILPFGFYAVTPNDFGYVDARFAIARSLGKMSIGMGFSYFYDFQNRTGRDGLYAGAAFVPMDNFAFGFTIFNLSKSDSLYGKVSMNASFFGKNINFYGSKDIAFAGGMPEPFNLGLEIFFLQSLFIRLGYDSRSGLKGGLGRTYTVNTVDIYLDLGIDSLIHSSRKYSLGLTLKFLGYYVWVDSDPKTIFLGPGVENNVVKICPRYELPSDIDRWILRITDRLGRVYKAYYGEGSPQGCLYWHGTDEDGNYVSGGVYYYDFYVKTIDGRVYNRKGGLVKIKKGG